MKFQTDDGLASKLAPFVEIDQETGEIGWLAFHPRDAATVVGVLVELTRDVREAAEYALSSGLIEGRPPMSVVEAVEAETAALQARALPPDETSTMFEHCPGSETLPIAIDHTGDRSLCSFCGQQIPITPYDGEHRLCVHQRPVREDV
jgi:hypothetical protein